jgi:hypothetical protein
MGMLQRRINAHSGEIMGFKDKVLHLAIYIHCTKTKCMRQKYAAILNTVPSKYNLISSSTDCIAEGQELRLESKTLISVS